VRVVATALDAVATTRFLGRVRGLYRFYNNPGIIQAMSDTNPRVAQRTGALAYSLRWLLLVVASGVIFSTAAADGPDNLAISLLVLTGLANFSLNLLETQNIGRHWVVGLTLALDFVLGLSLYIATGGAGGRLLWIGLMPALTIALRFSAAQALMVMGAFLALQVGADWVTAPDELVAAITLALAGALLMLLVLGAAYLGQQVRARIYADVRSQASSESMRAQTLRQHARAIYEMSSMVSATLDYKEVLEAALNFGALGAEGQQPSASLLVSAVLFFEDDLLQVASCRRLTAADQRVVLAGRAGVLGEVIRTGEPAVIADPEHDPELQQMVSFRPCRALMALPLRAGYETYGVVVYGHPRPKFFDEDQQALMVAVVNQAIIALQNAQLYRNLRQEKERLIEVQEEAQKKLARDLHDGPTQGVAALAMRANFVRRLLERDPKGAGEELFKMEDLARKTTKEIRHMLFTLRPLVLESHGLAAALIQLGEKMKETHGQNVIVEAEAGLDQRLELNHQGVLFYIVEEAVNNARKHAQAEHIWVRLRVQGDVLGVEIQDDGVGFNVGAVDANYERRGSLGMVNMRERAEMISGIVRIDSSEGRGTRVMIYVPLTEAAKEHMRA
jgi:signal transduction histidine kinase